MSERDELREWCLGFDHQWKETYYGYECEHCHEFIPFGCEPWVEDDDEKNQEYVAEESYL